jgi:hypothetical protein
MEHAMKFAASIILLAVLGGCSPEAAQSDKKVLCSLEGEAFFVHPISAGWASHVIRAPSADGLCKK